jgi:hypothetical protein
MVITSCNFAKEELQQMVEGYGGGGKWRTVGGLSYPSFTFGGSDGSRVATLAFLRLP